MCQCLNIPRSSYYYKAVVPVSEAQLEEMVKRIFLDNKSRYGARKIKKCLEGGWAKRPTSLLRVRVNISAQWLIGRFVRVLHSKSDLINCAGAGRRTLFLISRVLSRSLAGGFVAS